MEHGPGEAVVERFWTHVSQGGDVVVVAGCDDAKSAEPANVAEHEVRAIVEPPHGAHPGVVVGAHRIFTCRRCDQERAGHAEVGDEFLAVVEIKDEVLAPAAHGSDRRSDRVECGCELLARMGVAGDQGTTGEPGRQLPSDRLHFGQFRHDATVASPFVDRMLTRFIDELLETAHVAETLDEAAQAEAWASGALAEWIDLGGTPSELATNIEASAPFAARLLDWLVDGAAPTVGPDWLPDLTTQTPTGAWRLSSGGEDPEGAVIIEFEAASGDRHAVSCTLADGVLVDCGVGPAGLAEAVAEDASAGMQVEALATDAAVDEVGVALRNLQPEILTVNGRLNVPMLLRRFGVDRAFAGPGALEAGASRSTIALPPRDPEDDAWAAELVRSALRLHDEPATWHGATESVPAMVHQVIADFGAAVAGGDPDTITVLDVAGLDVSGLDASGLDVVALDASGPTAVDTLLHAVGAYLRPADLSMHPVTVQEALIELEWADWLGAVLGLARSAVGTEVDGRMLVQLINRCPEITTTIPAKDASRIGWAFEQTLYAWAATGVLDATGALTDAGRWLLPRAAMMVWGAQPEG